MNLQLQNQGCWESLNYVRSSILSLYTLGLRSKVDNLHLYLAPLETSDGDRLSAILIDLRSSSLQLRLRVPEFDMSKLGGFLAPIVETLTSIYLAVNLHGQVYVDPSPVFVSDYFILLCYHRTNCSHAVRSQCLPHWPRSRSNYCIYTFAVNANDISHGPGPTAKTANPYAERDLLVIFRWTIWI